MASLTIPTLSRRTLNAFCRRSFRPQTPCAAALPSQSTSSPFANGLFQHRFHQHRLGSRETVVSFHATGRSLILPPLPQRIQGTANDPAPVPPTDPAHGSYHWSFERLIAASLIPLTVAPFAAGSLNPVMDASLCALVLIHSHIGFEAMIVDYFPNYRVPRVRKFLVWILKGATIAVAVGLYSFETHDVGVTEAIKRIWHA